MDKADIVVDGNGNFRSSGSTTDIVAWLRRKFWSETDSGTRITVGETGETLTVIEYLEKFDPEYPDIYDIKPPEELTDEIYVDPKDN